MIQVIEQFIVNYLNGGWANLFLRVAIMKKKKKKKRESSTERID